jgi:S1-C subfamily serine protease
MTTRIAPVLAAFLLWITSPLTRAETLEDSVVRVHASIRLPNPVRPWTKQNPVESMGTGVVIEGKTILTNAHIVIYAGEVYVQGRGGGDRVPAKVQSIGLDADLATLTLEDESFFDKRPPLPPAAKRPAVGEVVTLFGYAVGSAGLTTTRGPVSRVEFGEYLDRGQGLRLQVNATAWPGNSGGPAVVDGRMTGLVFRRLENMAYVIPNEEIDAYLEDVKDGRYDGKFQVVDHFQPLVNEALRKKLGLGRADRGILVRKPTSCADDHSLCESDVLTHIGGVAVDNEGMVELEPNLRLPFTALVPRLAPQGKIPARLIRAGKPQEIALPVSRDDNRLIKSYRGHYPSYFVHGPLVFSPAMDGALSTYAQVNPLAMAGSPLATRESDREAFPGEELVVVTAPMFAHRLMRGYEDPVGQVVKDVDGVSVKNLRHLVELLRDARGEFLTIRFHGDFSETLVFPRLAIEEATQELMAENGVPRRGSDDLMAVWNARPETAR